MVTWRQSPVIGCSPDALSSHITQFDKILNKSVEIFYQSEFWLQVLGCGGVSKPRCPHFHSSVVGESTVVEQQPVCAENVNFTNNNVNYKRACRTGRCVQSTQRRSWMYMYSLDQQETHRKTIAMNNRTQLEGCHPGSTHVESNLPVEIPGKLRMYTKYACLL